MRVRKLPFLFPGAALLLMFFTGISCGPRINKLQSPPHYSFADPYTDKLDDPLKEISGITWDSKNNVFIANNDELGKLYFLDKETKRISASYLFGDKGDYEDVAQYNGVPYILKSDGQLTKFAKDSTGKSYGIDAGKISLSGINDFETLYADPARKALVLICKNCASDDEKTVSAFAYYPDSIGFDNKPLFRIDAGEVEQLSPFKTSKFQPSGAAIHPILKKLFILSSASHQLVITDLDGRVESVFKLTSKVFPQPEGITFKQNGDMYISNEGRDGKPTLLKFLYKDTAAEKNNETTKKTNKGGTSLKYDFTSPDEKMELGKHLHEISGMAYISGSGLILGENDEKGDIFSFDFKNKNDKVGKVKFGGKGDYEDIVYTDSAVYMLISSGTIVKVLTKDSSFATQEFTLSAEKNEFETLYLGADKRSLIMLCKECAREKKTGIRAAYRFDLATNSFAPIPVYTIAIADIQRMLNDNEALFKPSAAAINPVTGKLFILASVGKLLVIADTYGKPEQVFRLDPKLYNQPEGMTFAPNGDLYISNEGGRGGGIATVLKFTPKK